MRKLLRWLFCLLTGCAHFPDIHYTPKYGIPVHVRGDVPVDQALVDAWIDTRADEWLNHRADWGCAAWTDDELRTCLTDRPVIVFPGWFLFNSTQGECMGLNWTDTGFPGGGSYIHVTIDFPALREFCPWDPDYVKVSADDDLLYSFGLRQLPHEWTHTARGAWHP